MWPCAEKRGDNAKNQQEAKSIETKKELGTNRNQNLFETHPKKKIKYPNLETLRLVACLATSASKAVPSMPPKAANFFNCLNPGGWTVPTLLSNLLYQRGNSLSIFRFFRDINLRMKPHRVEPINEALYR